MSSCQRIKRILIVDDEIQFVEVMGEILANDNYEIIGTTNLKQAINLAGEKHFDVVLLDGSVQEHHDGVKFLASNKRKIPVIGVSGNPLSNAVLRRNGAIKTFEKSMIRQIADYVQFKCD